MSEYAKYLEYESTKEVDPRIERAEERKSRLEEELAMIEGFEYISPDIKEDAEDYYNTEIRACERDIACFERMGA